METFLVSDILAVNLKVVDSFIEEKEEEASHWVSVLYFSVPLPLPQFFDSYRLYQSQACCIWLCRLKMAPPESFGLDEHVNVGLDGNSSCYINRDTDADCR